MLFTPKSIYSFKSYRVNDYIRGYPTVYLRRSVKITLQLGEQLIDYNELTSSVL